MIDTEVAQARAPSPAPAGAATAARSLAGLNVPLLVLAILIGGGLAIRLAVAHQPMFADELSTYWIVAHHGLAGVMALLYSTSKIKHAEITPPLFFIASWLTTQLGHAPELVRAPSLIAGTLTIPLVYALGRQTVGRWAALLAATFTALSPFMIYYSAEARSYAVMMLLTTASTVAMLRGVETRRRRWWAAYAACSFGAFYTHYTCIFVLLAQFVWLWWTHPEARRAAVIANAAAVAALLPWASGFVNDLNSPTTKILSALSPFDAHSVRVDLEHWAIGFPYVAAGGLRGLPGTTALLLFGMAALITAAGTAWRALRAGVPRWIAGAEPGVVLVLALALSAPLAEAALSAVSTHLFGVRNLAASWPAVALTCAAAVAALGPRARIGAAALAVCAFGIAAAKMLTVRYGRPAFDAAAAFVQRSAGPRDVVVDGTGLLSPGPLTGLDLVLHTRLPVIRFDAPGQSDHPYTVFDPVATPRQVAAKALSLAHGGRIFVVAYTPPGHPQPPLTQLSAGGYRIRAVRSYHEFMVITVDVWAPASRSRQ